MFNLSPIFRITLGLLLLTISLLLIGDLLGLVPNQNAAKLEARKNIAETLAVQISYEISQKNLETASQVLSTIVKRNADIQSIGLRAQSKELVLDTGEHSKYWELEQDSEKSTDRNVLVPIYNQDGRWGTLEVSFAPLQSGLATILENRSFAMMVLFVAIAGFLGYWLFLKRALRELDPSAAVPDRVRSALDVLVEGVAILDHSERIVLVNKALEVKLGLPEEKLLGKPLASFAWSSDRPDFIKDQKMPWTLLFDSHQAPPTSHFKLKTERGVVLDVEINVAAISQPNKKIKGVIVTINDVTLLAKKNQELKVAIEHLESVQSEIHRQNIELTELATRDSLTNVLNRRTLFEGFDLLLDEAIQTEQLVSCIMVDIDHFKSVNDTYGHSTGDNVIKLLAKVFKTYARSNDLVGRYGGEEFVMVLPGVSECEAAEIAEQMRIYLSEYDTSDIAPALVVTASFGVSSTEQGVLVASEIVSFADQALYKAKESGRNRVVCYSNLDEQFQPINQKTIEDFEFTAEAIKTKIHNLQIQKAQILDSDPVEQQDVSLISNRIVLFDRIKQAIKLADRHKKNIAILTIEVDIIRQINNTLGHSAAEKLRRVAMQRLLSVFRTSDSVLPGFNAHYTMSLSTSGESQFTAILSDIESIDTTTWAIQRMFKELQSPVTIDGTEIIMRANVGGSIYPNDSSTPEGLLANSNMALQEANKFYERGISLFYNQEMNSFSQLQLKLESQLYQAIEREQFELYYQPIINMESGQIDKCEALLRWTHPEFGQVSPHVFIEIAEHTGTIKKIGKWVFEHACLQLKSWQSQSYKNLQMSINLSAVQFNEEALVESFLEVVERIGIKPNDIIFEITETSILKRVDHVLGVIKQLHKEGFQIALDDFGTGYSSLDFLNKFPIDWIKIDRSFMENFPQQSNELSIVSGLINLAHNLGIKVIIEGVEQEAQIPMLYNLQSDYVQGYLFARAIPSEEFAEFLESNQPRRLLRKAKLTTNRAVGQEAEIFLDILNPLPNHH